MYDNIPTEGCTLEIMGYPFFIESISVNEAFRRREYNFNSIVGGTQKVNAGAYVGLDFSITTHVKVPVDRPDVHNTVFQEMMAKPVEVVSPELGGRFNAVVVIKPEQEKFGWLKLTISIKEVPDSKSSIPGEEFTVPAAKKVEVKKADKKDSKDKDKDSKKKTSKTKSKKKTVTKKSKSKSKSKSK